ncbi:MAG: aminoglycoside 3'-phosphotransferase/choline kinase family protein [Rubrivivax sp.]|nr:aminoglycoside 3'-phosphotransferase/choline kinase family protein [Rubrivivax sp.]
MVAAVTAAIPGLPGPVQPVGSGTVFVALLSRTQVLKLYPPFLRDHFAFERAALSAIGHRLPVPTPQLLRTGECEGWPWLVMTQLAGEPLTGAWPGLHEDDKCRLLQTLGALGAQVHRLPADTPKDRAPRWDHFIAGQRALCHGRQQRTGLPAHLLAQLPAFLDGPLPEGPDIILTGEYTPMNLLVQGAHLSGMFDFGDGLLGPAPYDWLGPLAFFSRRPGSALPGFLRGL